MKKITLTIKWNLAKNRWALEKIGELIEKDPHKNSDAGKLIKILSDIVVAYEKIAYPPKEKP